MMYTEVRGRSMWVQVALCSGDMTGIWLLPAFLVSSAMAFLRANAPGMKMTAGTPRGTLAHTVLKPEHRMSLLLSLRESRKLF